MQQSRNLEAASGPLYDQLLVTLVAEGDRVAVERLYRRWHPRLVRTARRYAGDAGLAEQLAQDCWLAVWRGINGLRDPSSFAPWIFGILRRQGAGQIARQQRERGKAIEAEPALPASQEDSVALRDAFAMLPADQRLAAHLHFVEGLTLGEIAAVQGIPIGTAKTRLFHARRKLKAALTGDIT